MHNIGLVPWPFIMRDTHYEEYVFWDFFEVFAGHMSFFWGATGTPVLDFKARVGGNKMYLIQMIKHFKSKTYI